MSRKTERLKRVVALQGKLRQVHETRHATLLGVANAAREESEQLLSTFERPGSLASLFPQNLHSRLVAADVRRQQALDAAEIEATNVTKAKLREDAASRNHSVARSREERASEEREALESLILRRPSYK